MSFNDKVVLVTGGSSGIGAATAYKFASEGAKVVIVGRNEEKLKQVANKCEQNGSKPLVIIADISKDESATLVVTETLNHFGKIDILVNNAGIMNTTSIISENVIETFDKVMRTNMRAVVKITNLAIKHILQNKGNIINISSIAAKSITTNESFAYCASKAALDIFTRCIALELAPHGVRVNGINPGPVVTDIMSGSMEHVTQEFKDMVWSQTANITPLKRVSQPEEIADLVLFVASDKARGMTGSTIVSDNGVLLSGMMNIGNISSGNI